MVMTACARIHAVSENDATSPGIWVTVTVHGETWAEMKEEAAQQFAQVLGPDWELVSAEIEVASRWSETAGGKRWVGRVTAQLVTAERER
jgi:hypothetical protein